MPFNRIRPIRSCQWYNGFMDTTSPSLLIRLQSANRDTVAWNRFVEMYTPLIWYWARKAGLQTDDAADLVQEVLVTLVRKLPEFRHDPQRSFRGWLRTVTLNKFREIRRRKSSQMAQAGTTQLVSIPVEDPGFWEDEYAGQVVARAMELARPLFEPETWNALQEYVKTGCPAAEAAERHGVSVWTVYAAKSRLLAHLREELEGLLD